MPIANKADQESLLKDSKVFCILPWTHMSVRANGRVTPCCMSEYVLGSLRQSTLREVWNSEAMRQLRLSLLQDKPHPACAKCHEHEGHAGQGLRSSKNISFSSHFNVVQSTRPDGTVDKLNLPYWDIKFSNLCNFRCRYCGPESSASWDRESFLVSTWDARRPQVLTPTVKPQELWRQLGGLIPHLEEIYFAGGEPLIMDECYMMLKILIARRMFHVRLVFNTNFSVTKFKGNDIMKLWDRFEDVRVGASLDAAGRRAEYIRKGSDWGQVLRNRQRMFEVCPRVKFSIDPAISVMNVLHFPDFYTDWLRRGYISPNGSAGNLLLEPPEYRIQILPEHLKDQVVGKYEKFIAEVLEPCAPGSAPAQSTIARLRSLLRFLTDRDMTDHLPRFRERTRMLDESRNERFTDVFPELAELMQAP